MKPLLFSAALLGVLPLGAKPLQVFILAGQSNMQGHARIETFDYIGDDPATAPLLGEMRAADGTPRVCDHVWISYLTDNNIIKQGKLTAGFGAPGNEVKIGPEFTFGLAMDKSCKDPVLLIKTAWGGKSLHTDFRPPSAGPYVLSSFQEAAYPKQEGHGIPKDFEKWKADKVKETGVYYRMMVEHVNKVLQDPKSVYPDYKPADGYRIAGFIWFQGWNDMCDGHVYPDNGKTGRFAPYTDLMAHFIRDVRKDFNAPKMPFVIGVMGVEGEKANPGITAFREAQAATAALPEFVGNVVAVPTAPYWDQKLGDIDASRGRISQMDWMIKTKNANGPNKDGSMTPEQQAEYLKDFRLKMLPPSDEEIWKRGASNAGYHYLGCAKTFARIGKAFAEANIELLRKAAAR